jgi:hypothetical protein
MFFASAVNKRFVFPRADEDFTFQILRCGKEMRPILWRGFYLLPFHVIPLVSFEPPGITG